MAWPEPVTLRGSRATLEPLTLARRDELIEAVRDGELWKLWYTSVPSPEQVKAEIERRLEQQRNGTMLPFAIIDAASGAAVGMTSYMNIDAETRRLEIGSTWYRKSVQRSALDRWRARARWPSVTTLVAIRNSHASKAFSWRSSSRPSKPLASPRINRIVKTS